MAAAVEVDRVVLADLVARVVVALVGLNRSAMARKKFCQSMALTGSEAVVVAELGQVPMARRVVLV